MEALKKEHLEVLNRLYSALHNIKKGSQEFKDTYDAVVCFAKAEYLYETTQDQAFLTATLCFREQKITLQEKQFFPKLDVQGLLDKFKEYEDRNISLFLRVLDSHLDDLTYEYTRRKLTGHLSPYDLIHKWTRVIKSLGKRKQYNIIIKVGCSSGRRFFPLGNLLQ